MTGYIDNTNPLHLSDNSLFLIDGGAPGVDGSPGAQATVEGTEELLDFMYEITGLSKDEKIKISGIYFTHAHGDHGRYVWLLLENFSDKLEVERAMFNFPSPTEIPIFAAIYWGITDILKSLIFLTLGLTTVLS